MNTQPAGGDVSEPRTGEKAVKLTFYEINAAANALAGVCRISPRSGQQTTADRAYYKLVDAARKFGKGV